MSPTPALFITASFAVVTALLWLAAGLITVAGTRSRGVGLAIVAAALGFGACALWWPVQAMRLQGPGAPVTSLAWLWPWLPALALIALTGTVASLWQRRRRAAAVLAGIAVPIVAYVHAMVSAPGIFRWADAPGGIGVASLTLALSIGLLLAQWPMPKGPIAWPLRFAGAALAAAAACLGAAISVPAGDAVRWVIGPEWLVVLGLVALGGVLLAVALQQPAVEPHHRTARASALDNLTGLPTRLFFEGQLVKAAKKCDRKSVRLAVLFIDLDGFKPVNDSFSHSNGDRVLEQVGQRLKAAARGLGLAARVGGDQFLLLAARNVTPDTAGWVADQLIASLSQPYKIADREIVISCSVGIAMYPDGCDPNKLIARADAAMYAAKRAGGARRCFYVPEMDNDVQQNFDMLRDLRQALAGDELELFFQPKIDAVSGKVTAAEALLRWNHPTRGIVMPAHFIPIAERSGLIGPIGNWVIEAACKQARAWRDKGLRMRVAINLSAYQMRQDDIADRIAEALARHRIQPALLTCEITETAAMEDTGATQETFRRLGEMGAHLSIDDFGTGYSSLAYLRKLPAEELKIDASFVKDLDSSPDARAVVDAVVKLAHALGLKVVAEGVESTRQQKILVELGCDELQGFLFAKPMTARALLLWAMDDRAASAVFRDSLFGETREATRSGEAPAQARRLG
jgi:diguanylate cyclase